MICSKAIYSARMLQLNVYHPCKRVGRTWARMTVWTNICRITRWVIGTWRGAHIITVPYFTKEVNPSLATPKVHSGDGRLAELPNTLWKWEVGFFLAHYCDVIMGAMASQITSLTIIHSIVYSGTDQRKRQSPASLASVRAIHRWPVNSPHKWPVARKMFPFVIFKSTNSKSFVQNCNLGTRSEIALNLK